MRPRIPTIRSVKKPILFLDSNALILALITVNVGHAIRRLLALGEQGVLDLRVSREVIGDVERFARVRNPDLLPRLALLMAQADIAPTAAPSEETVLFCETLTGYRPDTRVLAAAIECGADVLVTRDAEHLLGNPKIVPPAVTLLVMNDQECLDWCFAQWLGNRR